ncbi:nitroreductase family protein [Petroclostridium sp. X23]|uniref:nitroreductase family protein n=1 Tax=Petroclostridium sp. X23 TaxID=3045146 RepID=UPI0024AD63B2|nr:nitroreductase family protein [Petroclostridium sp. X23]WHH58852.1 nitroreductase family protein [Petroclostridium sp. X23]
MVFIELAKKRYSVRSYKNIPVEREKILEILEAGRVAPSAVNFQPLRFIVVQDEQVKKDIISTYPREWIKSAPAIIVICGDHSTAWRRADGKDHCDIDAAIAIDHMTLAAADLGLGTCWVCAFNSMQCHKILKLPSNLEVIALLPLGYPMDQADSERHSQKRKKIEDIVHWDKYSE